jgi:gas vesicle protein
MAEGPCKADRKKLCADVSSGKGGEIMKCLNENADKLSEACKASLKKAKEQIHQVRDVCESDFESVCPGLKGKERRKCLKKNQSKLSDTCKSKLKEIKDLRKSKGH